MQIPCQKNNVFGIYHHFREHPDGNDKKNSIQIWPAPKKIKDLQKLFGFMGFYQNMIPKYAEWTSSMTNLLQKNKKFEWGPDQTLGLAKLKKHFATNKPLAIHDPKKQIKLQINVSDRTIKTMVFQQKKLWIIIQKN